MSFTLFLGTMFAGKTTALFKKMDENNEVAILLTPRGDTRNEIGYVKSHCGALRPAVVVGSSAEIKLLYDEGHLDNLTTICFDELQFFDEGIVEVIKMLIAAGKHVYGSGLGCTMKGKMFPVMEKAWEEILGAKILMFHTKCFYCGNPEGIMNIFNHGLPPHPESPLEVYIGGSDKYSVSCVSCFNTLKLYGEGAKIVLGGPPPGFIVHFDDGAPKHRELGNNGVAWL